MCLALCADAVIGNVQEKAMKQYDESNANVVSHALWPRCVSALAAAAAACVAVPNEHYTVAVVH